MKPRILLFALATALMTGGCRLFKGDEDEFKTPDLFFAKAEQWLCEGAYYASSKIGLEWQDRVYDCDHTMLAEMQRITEYQEVSRPSDMSDVYFLYENWVPATSGPNIARMTIFEDGYLEIYRKQSLGKHHYFYFSIDPELAASLNRFAETNILEVKEEESRQTEIGLSNEDGVIPE